MNQNFDNEKEESDRVWIETLQNDNARLRADAQYWQEKYDQTRAWAYFYRDQADRFQKLLEAQGIFNEQSDA